MDLTTIQYNQQSIAQYNMNEMSYNNQNLSLYNYHMPSTQMGMSNVSNEQENLGFMHNVRSYLAQQKLNRVDESQDRQKVSTGESSKQVSDENVNNGETKKTKKAKKVKKAKTGISLQEQRCIDMNVRFKKILEYLKNSKDDVSVLFD